MSFIYHLVPKTLIGSDLIPLKDLKTHLPELYAREVQKYDDHPQRKLLPQRILKKLNCRQEEVLHFTPIHPHLMFEGLKAEFHNWDDSAHFFEIPIERIRGIPAIQEMFEWVTPESYQMLTELPPEAIEFYQQWKARGQRGAPAMGRIPHVMVKGRVSIEGCRTLDWKNKPFCIGPSH